MVIPSRSEFRQTFSLASCGNILCKAERELERLKQAKSHHDLADHAKNLAVTLWHLADWVWECHSDLVRAHLNLPPKDKEAQQEFLRVLTANSPCLGACDVIANAAKHGGFAEKKVRNRRDVNVVRRLVDGDVTGILTGAETGIWSLEITIDGHSHRAADLFASACHEWNDFLYRIGVFQAESVQNA